MKLVLFFFDASLNLLGRARRGGRGESALCFFDLPKCGTSGRLSSEEESAVVGTTEASKEGTTEERPACNTLGRVAGAWRQGGPGGRVGRAAEGRVGRAAEAWVEGGGSGLESICIAVLGNAGEIRLSKREVEAAMAGKEEEEVGREGPSG